MSHHDDVYGHTSYFPTAVAMRTSREMRHVGFVLPMPVLARYRRLDIVGILSNQPVSFVGVEHDALGFFGPPRVSPVLAARLLWRPAGSQGESITDCRTEELQEKLDRSITAATRTASIPRPSAIETTLRGLNGLATMQTVGGFGVETAHRALAALQPAISAVMHVIEESRTMPCVVAFAYGLGEMPEAVQP